MILQDSMHLSSAIEFIHTVNICFKDCDLSFFDNTVNCFIAVDVKSDILVFHAQKKLIYFFSSEQKYLRVVSFENAAMANN
jgi:hypothetical protein